ncbi:sulfatase-like hydrolase/transferase [Sabulilitoribacter arenilitoris]|uniref:Sulfatase-like hydrolase/transferase n=1 Tax=Wocania arenilitoris TaxID=2044858 RepID=A0AAE3JP97_9FLAO|nr:sulfatase-like hydrolase/transferase [Wocania arenilitoris]MCF7569496.1 sulfatase-like hydrolase/transferase [Wocania arenilitoris]
MNKFFKIFSGYFLLILVAFIFETVFNSLKVNAFHNLIENILFAIALIIPLYFFKKKIISRAYFVFSYLVFSFCIIFETVYFYLFKTYFSSSAIFVILESNTNEAKEFSSFYINKPAIAFLLIIALIVLFVLKKQKISSFVSSTVTTKKKIKLLSVFILILTFLKLTTLIVFNVPYLILKSSFEYHIESKKLGDYKKNKNGNFTNVFQSKKDEEEVHVVILGESTTRSHLGIYNYYRETTPGLNRLKDRLLVFNDVISPHAYSVGSLTKMLTLGNYESPEKVSEGSIIQLANSADYTTYWLSNQRPIGPYESMITKISLSAKTSKFLTTTIAGNSKVLDETIIPEFNKALNNNVKRKVIFIHLMGTHHHYENRYPLAFAKFENQPKTKFKSTESFKKINHYDNAVLYNDFIISKIIKKVDSLETKGTVLFLSDHGEEMFNDLNMAGHNEDIYSKQMFDIPFLLWQSEKYKQQKNLFFDKERNYMVDDLFHSLADLLCIKANEVDTTRSIFSKYFKERKRIIKDTINYDTFFKK